MVSLAKLLFGREAGVLAELFGPDDRAGSDLAEQARRAGEWCATTPGHGFIPPSRLTAHVLGMSSVLRGYATGGPETAASS
jgi:hypothetical protein